MSEHVGISFKINIFNNMEYLKTELKVLNSMLNTAKKHVKCLVGNGHATMDGHDVIDGTYKERLHEAKTRLDLYEHELKMFKLRYPDIKLGGIKYRTHTNF